VKRLPVLKLSWLLGTLVPVALVLGTLGGCATGPIHRQVTLVRGDQLSFCVPAADPSEAAPGADGKLAGFDPDLARDLAGRLGSPAYLVSVPPAWAKDGRALDGSRCDLLTGVIRGDKTPAVLRLTADYRRGRIGVLVTARSTLDDLTGRRVGAVAGSAAAAVLASPAFRTGPAFRAGNGTPARVTTVTRPALRDALRALDRGEVEALVGDLPELSYQARSHPTRYRVTSRVEAGEPVALAVRADADPRLRAAVDEALHDSIADGTVDRLRTRWAAG
jgi:ABC-type amino acid transport substrate-binding protein